MGTAATDQQSAPQLADGPGFIIIRGLPGSGKSYVAKALQTALGAGRVVILDPDATDYESPEYRDFVKQLAAEGVEEKFYPYRFLRKQAYEAITARKIVIWNQAFTLWGGFERTIHNLQEHAAGQGLALPTLVVEVSIDVEVARQRVAVRAAGGGHDVTAENFERFIRDYVSFAGKGDFYEVVIIDGQADTQVSVPAILTAFAELKR